MTGTKTHRVEVSDAVVAAARPGQMYGWPGLTVALGGTLIAAISERKHHVCPFGRIVIVKSQPGSGEWNLPEEIANSELDDRHPSLATMQDGTVVCSFLTVNAWMRGPDVKDEWKGRASRITDEMLEASLGDWLVRSLDGGATWEESPHRMPNGGSLHASPYAACDGTLVCFGYEMTAGVVQPYFYRSVDRGLTWEKAGEVPPVDSVRGAFAWAPWQITRGEEVETTPLNMRAIVETSPGHMLAMFSGAQGFLYQSESTDNGGTWSKPEQTPIWGFPPQLLKLESGALLCTFGHRRDPFSIRGVFSYDDGKTWAVDELVTIDQWNDQPDAGYPVAVETSPGKITVVYYCHREPGYSGPAGLLARQLTVS